MNETTPFTAGSSAQTAEGPVELGVVVSRDAMGVVVEAPFLGRLRAAFDVLDDGSARLSALTRLGSDGVEVHVAGNAELARVARLSAALDDSRAWEPRARAAETSLAQSVAREQTLGADLTATRATLESTRSRLARAENARDDALARLKTSEEGRARVTVERDAAQSALTAATADLTASRGAHAALSQTAQALRTELGATKQERDGARQQLRSSEERLAETTAQLDTAQGALATTSDELDTTRSALAAAEAAHAELSEARAQLAQTGADLTAARTKVDELTKTGQIFRGELSAAKQERDDAATRALDLEQTAAFAQSRGEALGAELATLRAEHVHTTGELDEERARRDELLRDLSYIQSQVSDLASTRGALVAKVGQMTSREEKRRKSTAEFSDVLRTAEVVAADRLMDARRQQARAGKLEEHVKDLEDQVGALIEQLRDAQIEAAKVGPLTSERDRLKVEIVFFQKQIAAALKARELAKK